MHRGALLRQPLAMAHVEAERDQDHRAHHDGEEQEAQQLVIALASRIEEIAEEMREDRRGIGEAVDRGRECRHGPGSAGPHP